MARPVTEIHYFEIVPHVEFGEVGPKFARYGKRSAAQVANGSDYRDAIRDAANTGNLPGAVTEVAAPTMGQFYQRLLDIHEPKGAAAQNRGARAYAFRLNAKVDDRDLTFADPPFIPMPTKSGNSDYFIKDYRETYSGKDGARWASFACDLDEVRESELAATIRRLHEEHAEAHRRGQDHDHALHHGSPLLVLPFCLNLRDSMIDAAPWVVDPSADYPRGTGSEGVAARDEGGPEDAGDRQIQSPGNASHGFRRPFFTHGGVHPPLMPFLIVEL